MANSEEVNSKHLRRMTFLTVACGTAASGALVKFAIDTMPEAPPPKAKNGETQKKSQPWVNAASKPAIATSEKAPPETNYVQQPKRSQLSKNPKSQPAIAPKPTIFNPIRTQLPIIEPPSNIPRSTPRRIVPVAQVPTITQQNSQEIASLDLPDQPPQLKDIRGHWAEYFIQTLANQRIVRGYADRSFRPDVGVDRVEFAQMIRQAFPETPAPISFQDLQTFAGHRAPTRAEAAMFIHQARVKSAMVLSVTDLRVAGEVARPGRYSLAGLSEQDPRLSKLPTIRRAIEYAGGLSPNADRSRVQIRRTTETGQQQTITVNLQNSDQDLVLEQGDEVVIPSVSVANKR